ncbi:glycogen debranching N-terminal domain-containing protein [Micromonospora sp. NPDC126480]|uniref:glycogen debranching N-terminal domain-containing protein n=1 Tax=Micromonospora sp. NPDC126480 TaxID=3155312 RepID=UPI0033325ED2
MTRMQLRARAGQRFAYHHRTMLVTDPSGMVTGNGAEGFYVHNTRLLSRMAWSVDGQAIQPFAVSEVGHDAVFAYAQVPEPPGEHAAEIYTEVSGVHLELAAFVTDGLRLRAEVVNHTHSTRSLAVGLQLAADFTGTAEADAGDPQQLGATAVEWSQAERLLRLCLDHPTLDRSVQVRVESEASCDWDGDALRIPLSVPGRGRSRVEITVTGVLDNHQYGPGPGRFRLGPVAALVSDRLGERPPELRASDASVQQAWDTAIEDLASLPLGLVEGPGALVAGVPLYDQFFGRDTLTTGWQALLALRTPLRDALRANAAFQGRRVDDWRDEEPGALLHQMGDPPASVLGDDPFDCYYGDYATPVDYLVMLGQYYGWTGDRNTAVDLLPAARRALTWLDRYGDLDGDGLLEYRQRSPKGVRHQGWKDAPNAIVDAGGREQEDPLVTCELQGYWYAALRHVAPVFAAAGDRMYARRLIARAARLRTLINRRLWRDHLDVYALGIAADGQPLDAVSSNAGHLLLTGVPTPEQGRRVARRLMRPDMFSGWGIRTLSIENPAYHPFSYHLGSVWPVEQASIAAGFARYGCWPELHTLARGFFDLAAIFTDNRIPEAVGGVARDADHPHPGIYPQANAPQSWSASAVILMIQSLLGLRPFAPAHLLLIDPHLPDWLPEMHLRRLPIGNSVVDLHVWRHRDRTRWRARVRHGRLLVLRRPTLRNQGAHAAQAVEWLLAR